MFRLEPQTLPLVAALAITVYVGVQELIRARWVKEDPVYRLGGALALLIALMLAARLVQRTSVDPWVAEVAIRAQVAVALALPLAAIVMTRLVWAGPMGGRLLTAGALGALALGSAVVFTPIFFGSGASLRSDALGATYFELPAGPGLLFLSPLSLLALGVCVWFVVRTPRLGAIAVPRREWIVLLVIFVVAALNDLLVGARVWNGIQLFEYAALVLMFEASRLVVRRTAESQAGLERAVHERTAELAARGAELGRALEQQRLGEARFRQLSEATVEGVVMHREGRILDVNESLARLRGRSASSLVAEPLSALFEAASAPDLVALASGSATSARLACEGGEPIPVEIVARALPDGQAGVGVLGIRDVRELKELRARVSRTERLAELGTLAAGAAHEINNPLTYVAYNAGEARELVETALRSGDPASLGPAPALLADVEDGCRRIAKVVAGLGDLARDRGDEQRRPIDVRESLDRALDLAMHQIRHRARVKRSYALALPRVSADETRLGQVFINGLVNAAHAIPSGHADANEIELCAAANAKGEVVVEIRDSGTGIAPEHRARVFDPFFTTKPVGTGTGLGLAISHEIVRGLGGTIAVEDRPGGGTVLRVVLPAALDETAHARSSRPGPMKRTALQVLVVDDEPLVARVLARALTGCEVTICTSGRSAYEALEKRSFDAIVCDLMMPDWTGMDLYEALARRNDGTHERVLFASGGVFTERARAFVQTHGVRLLEKPISVRELRRAVDTIAGAGAPPPSP